MDNIPEAVKIAVIGKIGFLNEEIEHLKPCVEYREGELKGYQDRLQDFIKKREELVKWCNDNGIVIK